MYSSIAESKSILVANILSRFVLKEFEVIVDEEFPKLDKLNKGEYLQVLSDTKGLYINEIRFPVKEVLSVKGANREELVHNLESLWKIHVEHVKEVVSHNYTIKSLREVHHTYVKGVKISKAICGISDLFILFDNCEIELIKNEIDKLDMHYIDYCIYRPGKDNDFITRKTIKNLNSIHNIVHKAIIFVGLGISDIGQIDNDIIIEEYWEQAYSPYTPTKEIDSETLKLGLLKTIKGLMKKFKSSKVYDFSSMDTSI